MSSEHYLNMSRGGLDYDLYVIDPQNKDTTLMQLRDCTHDALRRLDERLSELEALMVSIRTEAAMYKAMNKLSGESKK